MSGRRRVGVVVLVDPPVGEWIDGLRRAVGDGSIDRIRPHVTLVPPLNLRPADLDAALARLRQAAAGVDGPLHLTLGPPATFLPANPVLFLDVGGDLEALRRLREAVFAAPLERPLTWPWVPHVTLADDVIPERIGPLTAALQPFAAATVADRVTLLEEHHTPLGRRWVALADASLGPARRIGRGGLELTLTEGRTLDPQAAAILGSVPDVRHADDRIVLTGVREGVIVGAAAAWRADDGGHVRVVVAPDARRHGVGGHLLAAVESAVRRAGWACPTLAAEGPAGFYAARSAYSKATEE